MGVVPTNSSASPPAHPAARGAGKTNEAHLNGRNLRLTTSDPRVSIDVPYLSGDLLDLTPQDPLSMWDFGSYRIHLQAADLRLKEGTINALMQDMLAQPGAGKLSQASVQLLDDNQLVGHARLKLLGIPFPLSLQGQVSVEGPHQVGLQLSSLSVLVIPVLGLFKLLGIDLGKFMPASAPVQTQGSHVTIDLGRIDRLQGDLQELTVTRGQLRVVFGGAPDPEVASAQRGGVPNYCDVQAKGEVALDSAILRDARVTVVDSTPQDPYTLNNWDKEGYARFQSGQLIMTEEKLRARFSQGMEGFKLGKLSLSGTDLVIEGNKTFLGVNVPVRFKLRWEPTKDGKLKLTPHDVHIVGIGFGASFVLDALAGMDGMKRDGDGVLLDLRKVASVEMPPLTQVRGEPRRIVLKT